jgi:putative CocE/NonD family hydrolase
MVEAWEKLVVSSPSARTIARPPEHEIGVERGIHVRLRDGTQLGAMLWRPKTPGRYPVLVERGPHRLDWRTGKAGEYYAARGYAVLSVNVRGSGESEGDFRGPMPGAPAGDGFDTVEWAAGQEWSNGRVGMLCGSVSGFTQYQTAVETPPHLTALLVRQAAGFDVYRAFVPGGAFSLAGLQFVAADWTRHRLEGLPAEHRALAERRVTEFQEAVAAAGQQFVEDPIDPSRRAAIVAPTTLAQHLPLAPHPFFSNVADYYNDWLAHPTSDVWWEEVNLSRRAKQVQIPICHLGGWFDALVRATLDAYTSMRSDAVARQEQRLIIGPWPHGPENIGVTRVGALEFGPQAALDFFAFRGRWYDHYLQDRPTDVTADPRVWLYLIGPDAWIGSETWPPPGVVEAPWYLRNGDGAGQLSTDPPSSSDGPDHYDYDPAHPVPSLAGGGPFGMGVDQAAVEHRLLTYTSPPLAHPLALVGPLQVVLYAASNAPDTDWVVKLTWVRPDESSIVLSGGILRARYHAGFEQATLLEPDRPTRLLVEMLPLSIVVPAGHRLRLTMTSSDFPAFDRNLNTGGPIGREIDGRTATNSIFHDAARPSHVILPILRGAVPAHPAFE